MVAAIILNLAILYAVFVTALVFLLWRFVINTQLQNEYQPDHVSAPGETLLETLETIGMSQAELARRMNFPVKTINEIIKGKFAITVGIASLLEQVLDIPASFWLKREQLYRESLARFEEV